MALSVYEVDLSDMLYHRRVVVLMLSPSKKARERRAAGKQRGFSFI